MDPERDGKVRNRQPLDLDKTMLVTAWEPHVPVPDISQFSIFLRFPIGTDSAAFGDLRDSFNAASPRKYSPSEILFRRGGPSKSDTFEA